MDLKDKIAAGMTKTRAGLGSRLAFLFRSRKSEKEFYDELEEILVTSDVGIKATQSIVASFRELAERKALTGGEALQAAFIAFLEELLRQVTAPELDRPGMNILMLLGVNGSGKTTTAGKLAKSAIASGKSVLLAAADTFRAAAADQLAEWSVRTGAALVRQQAGADPGAVVYDALDAARARKHDLVIIDTAGRFHNRDNLVRELQKIDKIVQAKLAENDGYYKMIVLDATAGSNAFMQASSFHEAVPLDAAILTKLDSSARGGVILPLIADLGLPLFRIGVGEGADDLVPFAASAWVHSLFG